MGGVKWQPNNLQSSSFFCFFLPLKNRLSEINLDFVGGGGGGEGGGVLDCFFKLKH
jgi:hypothetical protein